jgi:hypothetical protein
MKVISVTLNWNSKIINRIDLEERNKLISEDLNNRNGFSGSLIALLL